MFLGLQIEAIELCSNFIVSGPFISTVENLYTALIPIHVNYSGITQISFSNSHSSNGTTEGSLANHGSHT